MGWASLIPINKAYCGSMRLSMSPAMRYRCTEQDLMHDAWTDAHMHSAWHHDTLATPSIEQCPCMPSTVTQHKGFDTPMLCLPMHHWCPHKDRFASVACIPTQHCIACMHMWTQGPPQLPPHQHSTTAAHMPPRLHSMLPQKGLCTCLCPRGPHMSS